jgi:hypothetical protein
VVVPVHIWAYAFRVSLDAVVALYVAFWLQLGAAAAVTVAILALTNARRDGCQGRICRNVHWGCYVNRDRISHGSSVCMTEYLIAARALMILWTNLAVMPVEIVFDAIEAELEHRGIEL